MPTQNIDYADKSTGGNFTAADANDIKSAVNTNAALQFINAPVLSSLPAVTASKAGEPFYYNGTLWTYAKTGQFGTLAEGTPWPVKGYKEWVGSLSQSGSDNPVIGVVSINDIGTLSVIRSSTGMFFFSFAGQSIESNASINVISEDVRTRVIFVGYIDAGNNRIEMYSLDFSGVESDGFLAKVFIRIYPPQS